MTRSINQYFNAKLMDLFDFTELLLCKKKINLTKNLICLLK